jgi:hypothetical protein
MIQHVQEDLAMGRGLTVNLFHNLQPFRSHSSHPVNYYKPVKQFVLGSERRCDTESCYVAS